MKNIFVLAILLLVFALPLYAQTKANDSLSIKKQEADTNKTKSTVNLDSAKSIETDSTKKVNSLQRQKDSLAVIQKNNEQLLKLSLSPFEVQKFNDIAQKQLKTFEGHINNMLNSLVTPEATYELLNKKVFDSQPFFGDEKAIDPDVVGNYEVSLRHYLQIVSNTTNKNYALSNLEIDSIYHTTSMPDSIFHNKQKQEFYFTRIIHKSNLSSLKRDAYIGFQKNNNEWEGKLFFILLYNPKKNLKTYKVPIREMKIISPKSVRDTTEQYNAKSFLISWSDSVFYNNLPKSMLANKQNNSVDDKNDNVKIDLYWRGLLQKNLVASTQNSGKYQVTKLTGIPTDNVYTILITSLKNPMLKVTSSEFSLEGDSTAKRIKIIELKSKKDTNSICVGDTLMLKIETTPNVKFLKVIYLKKDKKGVFKFQGNVAHDNLRNRTDYIEWVIGKKGSDSFKNKEEIKILLQDAYAPNIKVESENIFIIDKECKKKQKPPN